MNVIGQLGSAATADGIFIFTTLFNLLIPSGPAKVPMLITLLLPVADALGMSRPVLCLAFQLGDGLTNYTTPVSSVLAAALATSGANYGKWLRYVLPYVCITFVISVAALTFLQSIGWSCRWGKKGQSGPAPRRPTSPRPAPRWPPPPPRLRSAPRPGCSGFW